MTKEQYEFVRDFIKLAKKPKNEKVESAGAEAEKDSLFGPSDKENSEKLSIEEMCKLLENHPGIEKADPFTNSKDEGDHLEGTFLKEAIDSYLEKVKMREYFKYDSTGCYFVMTVKGIDEFQTYKREITAKIVLPIISMLVSIASAIVSIVVSIIK